MKQEFAQIHLKEPEMLWNARYQELGHERRCTSLFSWILCQKVTFEEIEDPSLEFLGLISAKFIQQNSEDLSLK